MKYFFLIFLVSQGCFASNLTVCAEDKRTPTQDMRIGRLKMSDYESACTVTMISKDCAVSAGHCLKYMKNVEFKVPRSRGVVLVTASAQNTYEIDYSSIVSRNGDLGNDWAVMKIKANNLTKKFPGEVGGFYPVNFSTPKVGEKISIAGYGRDDRRELNSNGVLQVDQGEIDNIYDEPSETQGPFKIVSYFIDTMPGDSGAALIRVNQKDIIGVHTNGGQCDGAGNFGTLISENKKFAQAIKSCLGAL